MTDSQQEKKKAKAKRFEMIYKKIGITQGELAEIVLSSQGNISNVFNGKRGVPSAWIYRLKERYKEVNINWILTGEGEPLVSAQRYLDMVAEDADILEDGATIAYEASNARPLRSDEIAVILARLQHEVSELQTWQAEAGRVIAALEVQVKRLKDGH